MALESEKEKELNEAAINLERATRNHNDFAAQQRQ